jgi:hypothetical protein
MAAFLSSLPAMKALLPEKAPEAKKEETADSGDLLFAMLGRANPEMKAIRRCAPRRQADEAFPKACSVSIRVRGEPPQFQCASAHPQGARIELGIYRQAKP